MIVRDLTGFTVLDDKINQSAAIDYLNLRWFRLSQWWRPINQSMLKRRKCFLGTFNLDFDLPTAIAHPARQSVFLGYSTDKGPKAHALHATGNNDM